MKKKKNICYVCSWFNFFRHNIFLSVPSKTIFHMLYFVFSRVRMTDHDSCVHIDAARDWDKPACRQLIRPPSYNNLISRLSYKLSRKQQRRCAFHPHETFIYVTVDLVMPLLSPKDNLISASQLQYLK